jgi:hypothetical protein
MVNFGGAKPIEITWAKVEQCGIWNTVIEITWAVVL